MGLKWVNGQLFIAELVKLVPSFQVNSCRTFGSGVSELSRCNFMPLFELWKFFCVFGQAIIDLKIFFFILIHRWCWQPHIGPCWPLLLKWQKNLGNMGLLHSFLLLLVLSWEQHLFILLIWWCRFWWVVYLFFWYRGLFGLSLVSALEGLLVCIWHMGGKQFYFDFFFFPLEIGST